MNKNSWLSCLMESRRGDGNAMLGIPGIVVAKLHIGMILYVMTLNDLCSPDLTNGVIVRPGAIRRVGIMIISQACIVRLLSTNPIIYNTVNYFTSLRP